MIVEIEDLSGAAHAIRLHIQTAHDECLGVVALNGTSTNRRVHAWSDIEHGRRGGVESAEALALARSLALLSDRMAAAAECGLPPEPAAYRHAARLTAAVEFDLPDPEAWAARS